MMVDHGVSWRTLFALPSPIASRSPIALPALVAMLVLVSFRTPVGLAGQAVGGGGMTYEVYSFSDSEATGLDQVSLITTPLAPSPCLWDRF